MKKNKVKKTPVKATVNRFDAAETGAAYEGPAFVAQLTTGTYLLIAGTFETFQEDYNEYAAQEDGPATAAYFEQFIAVRDPTAMPSVYRVQRVLLDASAVTHAADQRANVRMFAEDWEGEKP